MNTTSGQVAKRTAQADQLHAELRDARCCDALDPCVDCRAKRDEVRLARREAMLHALATVRPRRPVL